MFVKCTSLFKKETSSLYERDNTNLIDDSSFKPSEARVKTQISLKANIKNYDNFVENVLSHATK